MRNQKPRNHGRGRGRGDSLLNENLWRDTDQITGDDDEQFSNECPTGRPWGTDGDQLFDTELTEEPTGDLERYVPEKPKLDPPLDESEVPCSSLDVHDDSHCGKLYVDDAHHDFTIKPCIVESCDLAILGAVLKMGQDKWVRAAHWRSEERTLALDLHPPSRDVAMHLAPPIRLFVYFPEDSYEDRPFCYCDCSHAPVEDKSFIQCSMAVAEAVNEDIVPLASGSLLSMIATIQRASARQQSELWEVIERPRVDAHRKMTQERLCRRLEADVMACDLSLSLLTIALRSSRRASVSKPLPIQFDLDIADPTTASSYNGCGSSSNQLEVIVRELDQLPSLAVLTKGVNMSKLPDSALAILAGLLLTAPITLRVRPDRPRGCDVHVAVDEAVESFEFDGLKRAHGVRVAYHGSSIDNWHTILHHGLQNRSGTKNMKHGAVFGDGIYLAGDPEVSRTFAKRSGIPRTFMSSRMGKDGSGGSGVGSGGMMMETRHSKTPPEFPFEIVACCEVIDLEKHHSQMIGGRPPGASQSGGGRKKSRSCDGDYLVVNEGSHVHITSLLLYQTAWSSTAGSHGAQQHSGDINWRSNWIRSSLFLVFLPLLIGLALGMG